MLSKTRNLLFIKFCCLSFLRLSLCAPVFQSRSIVGVSSTIPECSGCDAPTKSSKGYSDCKPDGCYKVEKQYMSYDNLDNIGRDESPVEDCNIHQENKQATSVPNSSSLPSDDLSLRDFLLIFLLPFYGSLYLILELLWCFTVFNIACTISKKLVSRTERIDGKFQKLMILLFLSILWVVVLLPIIFPLGISILFAKKKKINSSFKHIIQQLKNKHNHHETPIPKNPDTIRIVTRTEVDRFIPNFTSSEVYHFDSLSPDQSFNKLVKFKDIQNITKGEENFCIICLEEYEDEDEVLLFPCEHYYHFQCLAEYSRVKGLGNVDPASNPRCTFCQLNLLRHYLYYKEYGLNLENSNFYNKE